MYCAFCGRELPKGEGCTCCRAVSARNDNPRYRDKKTLFQTGTPLEFDHEHANSKFITDGYGKLDSCRYGGQDSHTRNNDPDFSDLEPVVINTQSSSNNNNNSSSCSGSIIAFFVIIFIIRILLTIIGEA